MMAEASCPRAKASAIVQLFVGGGPNRKAKDSSSSRIDETVEESKVLLLFHLAYIILEWGTPPHLRTPTVRLVKTKKKGKCERTPQRQKIKEKKENPSTKRPPRSGCGWFLF